MRIELTPAFQTAFPEGVFGALAVRDCLNRPRAAAIVPDQREVEGRLRARFPDEAIHADPVALAYAAYFRRFRERYPVVHQAKTVLAGRSIESPSALVAAMFTAELDSLVLTSGHDLHVLQSALRVDVARENDRYTKLSGKAQPLRAGDMVVRDAAGIIASVLYGPDQRTRLREDSADALFCAWCPLGVPVAMVEAHLGMLAALVRREWPEGVVEDAQILTVNHRDRS